MSKSPNQYQNIFEALLSPDGLAEWVQDLIYMRQAFDGHCKIKEMDKHEKANYSNRLDLLCMALAEANKELSKNA